MRKSGKEVERKSLSSSEFTKLFIKHFILNSIFVGIVLYILYGFINEFVPDTISTILSFILFFIGMIKIYLSAINNSFYEGKINQSDVIKIANNIIITFIVVLFINITFDYISYINSLEYAKIFGIEDTALKSFITNIIFNIFTYIVIAISCRIKFIKDASDPNNLI